MMFLVLNAIATSGLDITYELVSGTATLDTDAMTLTPTAEGTVEIKASQAGDVGFNAATDVTLSIVIIKRDQTISFDPTLVINVGDTIILDATASSGLDVTYQLISGNATVSNDTLIIFR